jgi:amidase
MGAHVEEALPPRIDEASLITRQYWQRPESASADEWLTTEEVQLTSLEVEQHLYSWDRFRRALIGFMEHYDVILTPVAERPATAHGTDGGWIPYTLPFSLTGWPCVVVRAGTAPDGLPIGVQVVAGPWRDDVALAAAQVIEHSLGGWHPPLFG